MFWGVTLETGKRYSQVVDSSYHLSMAALEPLPSAESSGSKYVSVMIEHNKSEFLLCTLEQNRVLQVTLDHCFVEGEEVAYFLTGEGTVHLTGYIITEGVNGTEDSDDSEESEEISNAGIRRLMKQNNNADEDSEDEVDEDWKPNALSTKELKKQLPGRDATKNSFKDAVKVSKKQAVKVKSEKPDSPLEKPQKLSSPKSMTQLKESPTNQLSLDEESSDDEEDEDFLMGDVDEEEEESGEESDDDEDNSDWEDTDDDDEDAPSHPGKKTKLDNSISKDTFSKPAKSKSMEELTGTPQATHKNPEKGSSKTKQKQSESSPQIKTPKQKLSLNTPEGSSEDTPHSASKFKKAFGGVEIQDVVVGNGPVAKPGKMVHVYYRGTFPNKQEFDSCTKGKAFSFRLGKSEVIKGWDVGVQGMKVGGKRKLIVPPSMGYGSKVSGPIPPNSTLHFEVELKAVS